MRQAMSFAQMRSKSRVSSPNTNQRSTKADPGLAPARVLARPLTRFLILSLALAATSPRACAADQVRIGIARTISDVGYYIADAMGFFREEDLEVSLIGFNSAAHIVAPL